MPESNIDNILNHLLPIITHAVLTAKQHAYNAVNKTVPPVGSLCWLTCSPRAHMSIIVFPLILTRIKDLGL